MDVHDSKTRSYNMSRIKGENTKPEETVRKYLFSQGFRYRKNDKRLPGKPDIVLPKYKTIIFVTHRTDNIDLFDRFIKMEDREILEDTTRNK